MTRPARGQSENRRRSYAGMLVRLYRTQHPSLSLCASTCKLTSHASTRGLILLIYVNMLIQTRLTTPSTVSTLVIRATLRGYSRMF